MVEDIDRLNEEIRITNQNLYGFGRDLGTIKTRLDDLEKRVAALENAR